MAQVNFSHSAPCGFLIESADGRSALVQTDWDYPAVAQCMGWSLRDFQPELPNYVGPDCPHEGTDGTVTCEECGATASDFISAAFDHILAHEGEEYPELDEYLGERQ